MATPEAPSTAPSERSFARKGFYGGFSVGGGSGDATRSGFTSDGYFNEGRAAGLAIAGHLGVALSPKLLVGGTVGGWSTNKESGGLTLSATTVRISPELSYYPLADQEGLASGLYLRGGMGLAGLTSKVESTVPGIKSDSTVRRGFGMHAGLGFEVPVTRVMYMGLALDYHRAWIEDDFTTNQVEAALSFAWY